jgi:hypothetical protein
MNPLFVVPLLVYTIVAVAWPNQVDGRRRGRGLLIFEAAIVAVALIVGYYLAKLVEPRAQGLWWGKAGLYLTAYLYVCARGATLIRGALEIAPLQFRRIEDRTAGGVGLARGRVVGILERAILLTLFLLGEYAAMAYLMVAKALVRFKSLEDPETAEYLLIGTLASFTLAILGAVGLRLLMAP